MKWLEDELELNALHSRGNGNEKAAVGQRTALSAALGGRVEVAAMSTISGLFIECFTPYMFFDSRKCKLFSIEINHGTLGMSVLHCRCLNMQLCLH